MFSVSCSKLCKSFPDQQPLQDLSFTFRAGEITSIVGESGCGKTTLLRLIAGLEKVDSGVISFIDGSNQQSQRHPVISTVFQEPRLFPWLTARQNIALAVRHKPMAEQKALIEDTLQIVGLSAAADKYPHQLSGGMAQRVGMARALCRHPDVLLLDEAFSALDALTRERLRSEFINIARARPMTTILVTHDVPEAVLLSKCICKLKNGRIQNVWDLESDYPRSIGQPAVAALADEILNSFFSNTNNDHSL